jgi:hypothetical protein
MSTTTVKTCSFKQNIYTKISQISSKTALLLSLCSCTAISVPGNNVTWKTYVNYRYGFEFPYPNDWKTLAASANNDGIVLASPENDTVEIRAWAANQLPELPETKHKTTINPNFQTAQGVSGVLQVEIVEEISTMTLSLNQNNVAYHWQARSQNQEFLDYYHLFYYIAYNYRIRNQAKTKHPSRISQNDALQHHNFLSQNQPFLQEWW